MASIASFSFSALGQSDRSSSFAPSRPFASAILICRRRRFPRRSLTSTYLRIHCMSTVSDAPPPVSETKSNFLKAYKRPIPSIYNTVLQELIVQQHLMRYKKTYRYDPVFALGFVTVYDQLMDGYPSDQDRDAHFKAYVEALNEDPNQYRMDAQKMEEWARSQTSASLVDFSSRDGGEVEAILKGIAARAGSKDGFSYSRFFAVGLFRLLELAGATDPTVLDKLCASLNINKKSVDRDLDVYRNLLSKLVQAKELLKEYVEREKKKRGERAESQKANETISKCLGSSLYNPSFLAVHSSGSLGASKSRNSLTAVVGVPRRKPSLLICHSALNAKCSEGQTQTVTRESPTINQAPVHSKEKSPDLDDGGAGFPPRDDGDGGGGGGVPKVVLKKGKTQLFKDGSPMVYSGAVDRIIGRPPPKTGDVVVVADGSENPIGWGLYNSVSMFCVRLMQLQHESIRDPSCALNIEKLLEARITEALELRNSLGLPSAHTNAYRLVNSEGDRLSGLIVDVFGDIAVVASSAAWLEKYRTQVQTCLRSIHGINHINWRPSLDVLKEDGFDVSTLKPTPSSSTLPHRSMVVENGISYAISLEGQKTGFYTDQRENRHFISTISAGKTVLDLCCYSGGFALNAARGGAASVVGVDSSLPALELARENVILNRMDPEKVVFFKQYSIEFMKGALSRGETWDIVILDPPKLAPRKKVLENASGMYRNLNSLAMRLTRRGGLLMTCSCSGAMTQSGKLLGVLQRAAAMAGRKITVVREAGAASDHPLDPSYPQGQYLSNILLRVL